ncbi:MAG: YkgJ family cysteine cluster protein [Hydrogenothermus sp.]|nr:MAG: YkgJ family cysteine cluster protein [Hydrogenothermus sp.]
MKQIWIDCSKGNANCCKNNLVELSINEFKFLYDKAPIVIMVKAFPKDGLKEIDKTFFEYKGIYFYLNFAMLIEPRCKFLEDSKCSIYEDRPGMCKIFPVFGYDEKTEKGVIRIDFCEACGEGCLNNNGEGFLLVDNNQLSKSIEDELKGFFKELDRSRFLLKTKVFDRLVRNIKTKYPNEFKSILVETINANKKNEDLWLSPVDPKLFPIVEKFLIKEDLSPKVFKNVQLGFLREIYA